MKKFKDFRAEQLDDDKEFIGFANSGGPEGQYNKIDLCNPVIFFASGGGNPEQYKNMFVGKGISEELLELIENLSPKNDKPLFHKTDSDVFYDPEYSYERLGFDKYHPRNYGTYEHSNFVNPQFDREHFINLKALHDNTNTSGHYDNIVNKYSKTSNNLNQTLIRNFKAGETPAPIIKANISDDSSHINIKHLDDLIHQHHLPHDMTVYSGLHFNPADEQYQKKIGHYPAYLSTSLSPHIAKDFGTEYTNIDKHGEEYYHHNILKLHLPKGTHHLFTDTSSVSPGQGELILPRGLKLQIGRKPKTVIAGHFIKHYNDKKPMLESVHHIWEGRVVHDKK